MVVMHDLARRGDGVRVEELDVVFVGELVGVHGADELLELPVGLPPEVAAIHEEQHPLRPAELDEPVAGIHGRERLARCRSPSGSASGALFLASDCSRFSIALVLHRPELRGVQRREGFQLAAHLGVELDEPEQLLGAMEGEDLPAAGIGLQQVRELRDGAGGLVGERQGLGVGGDGRRAEPPAYLADCVSTPIRGCPFGLASTTPMALPPT